MARRKRNILAGIASQSCKLEMTPMIDVTFLLLIFFMCTLKFKTLEGKLSAFLPKDVGVNTSDAIPKEKIEIRMDIRTAGAKVKPKGKGAYTQEDADAKNRFVFDDSRVIRYSIGPKQTTDLAEVERTLKTFFAQDPTRPATIDPREGIVVTDVVDVLDIAMNVGFKDITFVGSYEK